MKSFFDSTRLEVSGSLGSRAMAARLYNVVYRDRCGDFRNATSLSAKDRAAAIPYYDLALPSVVSRFVSADGTRRYVLRLNDAEVIESVLIPERGRSTFCISSQVGCALACKFCLTGQLGLTRNLSAAEIVGQVMLLRGEISQEISNRFSVVLMGMGEPLQNYDNVMKAIQILSDDHGLALPLRRITLSTAGLVPGLERLRREAVFPNLCISLTGATNRLRDELMPINKKYAIEDVIEIIRNLPDSRRKRVMFEYVMMKGVTDSIDDAGNLSSLLKGLRAKVNLIPLNESPDIHFQRSIQPEILRFQEVLVRNGITTFIRKNRGGDVNGACGQLKKANQI